ncbi:MBL fold metallo-hydrolase [Luteitalea sp. TBR-22]|uniref:MBL fold metallo-hydrolase n=1 Tax=Luteitalea sp. TBR-22 TaxID=2802971 RepID=UPI001AF7FFD4|nr:MBL fold metallo-hydrolase [Luteitalea sp. TBR-22]BCS30997.1 MBL fold metallo-hydrolase [Luteitalea sp. TBR-22]
MIVPYQQDDALLLDIGAAADHDGHAHLWWLGQSGFLVQFDGWHLLLDPYLSDSLTAKYAATDRPHIRMTERVIDPGRLDFIDVVTSSHNHTDHLDAETLKPLRFANPAITLVVAEANRAFVAERLGVAAEVPVGVAVGEHVDVGPFRIEAVPAAHEALSPEFVGYVVRCGEWTLYHSGDTVRFEGMADLLRPHQVDVALLPINGRAPERRVAGNLDAREAAVLGRDIGARVVIPCHYEMFTFNTADPATFVEACHEVGQQCHVLRCGEGWTTAALGEGTPGTP